MASLTIPATIHQTRHPDDGYGNISSLKSWIYYLLRKNKTRQKKAETKQEIIFQDKNNVKWTNVLNMFVSVLSDLQPINGRQKKIRVPNNLCSVANVSINNASDMRRRRRNYKLNSSANNTSEKKQHKG